MPTVDEFVIKIVSDTKPLFKALDESDQKITQFVRKAGTAIGGLFAIGAMKGFAQQMLATVDATGKFASTVGENVERLSKFEEVVKRSGGSVSGLRSSITSLSQKMTEARISGGESALIFQRLGLSITDSQGNLRKSTDVMLSLNQQFQRFSKTEQVGLGKKLGLDEGTIRMLQSSPKDLDALLKRQEKLGVVTSDMAEKSAELNNLFADFMQVVRMTGMMILTVLIPVIKGITNALIEIIAFIRDRKAFVLAFFITLATVIMINVIPALIAMTKASIAAFAPYLLIGAKLALVAGLVALLVDDIVNFMKGNNSLIGVILKGLEVWFKAFMGFFTKVKTNIANVFRDIKNNISGFVQPIIDGLIGAFNGLKAQLSNVMNPIREALMPITKLFDGIGGFFKGGSNTLAVQGAGGKGTLSTSNNNNNQMSVENINISTNGDAKNIGESITSGLADGWNALVNRNNGARKS